MSKILILGLLIALFSPSNCAWAIDPVSATYQPVSDGYFIQFVVHNTFSTGIGYWLVVTDDATSPSGPAGWHVYQNAREVGWDVFGQSHTYDIQPGASLGGFSYISNNAPGALGWYIATDYGLTGTVTPVPVPEPSSLLALAGGIAGLGGFMMRLRSVQSIQCTE